MDSDSLIHNWTDSLDYRHDMKKTWPAQSNITAKPHQSHTLPRLNDLDGEEEIQADKHAGNHRRQMAKSRGGSGSRARANNECGHRHFVSGNKLCLNHVVHLLRVGSAAHPRNSSISSSTVN